MTTRRKIGISGRRTKRALLLGSASALVLCGGLAAAAFAADVNVPTIDATTATATGFKSSLTNPVNAGDITASVTSAPLSDTGDTIHITTTGSGTTNTTIDNTVGAFATGNTNSNTVSLSQIGSNVGDDTGGDGIAILAYSANTGATIAATATTNTVSQALTDFISGTSTNDGNTITAQATGNNNTAKVTSAAIPLAYTDSSTTGGIAFAPDGADVLHTTGSIAVANTQLNQGSGQSAGSAATLTDNSVTTVIAPDSAAAGAQDVTASPDVSTNTLSAIYAGNTADNGVGIGTGGLPTFTGSVSLANAQGNFDAAGGIGALPEAYNTGSEVTATMVGVTGAAETLQGALTVDSNVISASATGNQAEGTSGSSGNVVDLTAGVNYAALDGQLQANTISYDPVNGVQGTVDGGLAVFNSQTNYSTSGLATLEGETVSALAAATVDNLDSGTVSVDSNQLTAAATANQAFNAIQAGVPVVGSLDGSTDSIDGPTAIGSLQSNNETAVLASNDGGEVLATIGDGTAALAGDLTDSAVNLNTNTIGATATANAVQNSLELQANGIDTGVGASTLTALRGAAPNDEGGTTNAVGGATINSVQSNDADAGATVVATTSGATAKLTAGDVADLSGDALKVDGNLLQAVALDNNSVGSAIDLTATDLAGSAGVLNAQTSNPSVTATLEGSSAQLLAGIGGADVTGSTLDESSNVLRALAYGNNASGNTVTVSATSLAVAANAATATDIVVDANNAAGLPFDNGVTAPTANGTFAVLSDQATLGDIDAEATATATPVLLEIGGEGGSLDDSTATADGNAFVSAARANVAANGVTIGGNAGIAVTGDAFAPIANVTNIQSVQNSDVTATTSSNDGGSPAAAIPSVLVSIADGVSGGSVDASTNQLGAFVEGNTSQNTLNVTATGIVDASATALTGASFDGTDLTTDAAFAITNAQSGGTGDRTADLTDTGVNIDIGTTITSAPVTAGGNSFTAQATDNTATNSFSLVSGAIDSSAAVQNFQTSDAAMQAIQGTAGSAAIPSTPFSFNATPVTHDNTGTGASFSVGGDGSVGNPYTYTGWLQTSDPSAVSAGWIAGTGAEAGSYFKQVTAYDTGATVPTIGTPFTFAGTIGGSPAVAGTGVVITSNGAVTNSKLSVTGNQFSANVTGNTATNTLSATGTTVDGGAGPILAANQGASDVFGTSTAATGDYAAANLQSFGGSLDAESNATAAIIDNTPVSAGTANTTGSTLSVSNNAAQAVAEANVATTTVTVGATDSPSGADGASAATASLLSDQEGNPTAIGAASNLIAEATGMVSTSNVSLSDNSNLALARVNDVTNSLTGSGGASLGSGYGADAAVGTYTAATSTTAVSDFALNNVQNAVGGDVTLSATATTSIGQSDVSTDGVVTSSGIALNGNKTTAEADVNLATNTLTLNAGSSLGANAALVNAQSSSVAAVASNTTAIGYSEPNAAGSSFSVTGNSSTAQASGNTATNALNATTGAQYVYQGADAQPAAQSTALNSPDNLSASAQYAVLNEQDNSGAVTATNTTTMEVALNSGLTGVTGSSVNNSGNSILAQATGNNASNSIGLTAVVGSGQTAALTSTQVNSANISATVTSSVVSAAAGATGAAVQTSSFNVSGNTITARAIGNAVTNAITSH